MTKTRFTRYAPGRDNILIVAVAVVLIFSGLVAESLIQRSLAVPHRKDQELETLLRLGSIRARIEESLAANLLILNGVANYVSLHPDMSREEFDHLAHQALSQSNLLWNIAAAPDMVVSFVYPLSGNEAILGVDYRELESQWPEVERVVEERRMVVAGPVALVQGGKGLIGRAPVFESRTGELWGLVSGVILLERLLEQAGMSMESSGLAIALRGKDGTGALGEVFYGDPYLFEPEREAVVMSVAVPNGSWQIAAVPALGWTDSHPDALEVSIGVAVIFLLLFILLVLRIRKGRQIQTIQTLLAEAQRIGRLGGLEWDPALDRITWSEECSRITGVDPELRHMPLDALLAKVHPEDRGGLQEAFHAVADRGSARRGFDMEVRLQRAGGQTIWVLIQGSRAGGSGRAATVVSAFMQEITRRKKAEMEVAKAREHLYNILEQTTDAFFETDHQFRLTHVNGKFCEAIGTGSDRASLQGRLLWEVLGESDLSVFRDELVQALERGEVRGFETFHEPGNAWLEVYAYPTRESLSVYFRDITERRRLQMERDNIFGLSLDMICIAGFDGYFKELNPAWERILGWSNEELLSRPWIDFVHPDDVEATIHAKSELVDGRPVYVFENRYRCKDGSIRWIAWNSYPEAGEQRIYAVARDVTGRKERDEALQKSEARFRRLVEGAPLGLALVGREGGLEYLNPRCVELLGYTLDEVGTLDDLWSASCPEAQACSITRENWSGIRRQAHSVGYEPVPMEHRARTKDGEDKYIEFRYMPLDDKGIALMTDVTLRKTLEQELTRLATTDPLTGALNRRRFMDRLEEELRRAGRYGRRLSVCMLDIDHFKSINDTYGHHAGDEVLKRLTRECATALRDNDVFGRLGGEEFAMVLPETDQEAALETADRLRRILEAVEVVVDGSRIRFTVSIGVAMARQEEKDLERLLSRADSALYEAKQGGRNQVRLG